MVAAAFSTSPTDESFPLLVDHSSEHYVPDLEDLPCPHPTNSREQATPLPKFQLFIVCLIRITEPFLYTQIFPYINQFILFLHLTDEPSLAGFYSGLLDSVFGVTQLLATYHWSKLSNRIGRKPVILAGTLGVALSTMYLGLSSSLTELLISRAIGGLFGGYIPVVQSVFGDLSDASNQAVAFPISAMAWPIGSIVGPLVGGVLSNPAEQYSKYTSFFRNSPFFINHPYFLPGFVSGFFALSCAVFAYFYLEESLHRKSTVSTLDSEVTGKFGEKSLWELLSVPFVRALAISIFSLNIIGVAFDFLFATVCFLPVETGGLSFSASTIGFALSSASVFYMLLQIFVMPTVLKRYEASTLYTLTVAFWVVVFAVLPFINIIARHGLVADMSVGPETGSDANMNRSNHHQSVFSTILVAIVVGFVLVMSKIASEAYSLCLVLIKTNTPDPALLALSNGIMSSAMSLARIISPTLASLLFAISKEHNILGGYFWAVVMVCSCILGYKLSKDVARLSRSSLTFHRME